MTILRPDILEVLACPVCKSQVVYVTEKIQCSACGRTYQVIKGVPIMLTEQHEELRRAYQHGSLMLTEFQKETTFSKLIHFARKIVSSDFVPFHPEEKWWGALINSQGSETKILEVGSGYRRLDKKVINMDLMMFPNVDVVGDGHSLPFKDASFDTVWMEAVLEHVRRPMDVVAESHRVLKEGGYIYAVAPFVTTYHGYPHDYFRYSRQGLGELFTQFREMESGVYRGPSVALVSFLSDYFSLFSFSTNWRIYLLTKALALCLIFPLKYLDLLLMKNAEAHRLAHCLYYIGMKGGG